MSAITRALETLTDEVRAVLRRDEEPGGWPACDDPAHAHQPPHVHLHPMNWQTITLADSEVPEDVVWGAPRR